MSPDRIRFSSTVRYASSTARDPRSPFSIDVEFGVGMTTKRREAFKLAAERWLRIIASGGPPVAAGGEAVDGLLILANCDAIASEGGLSADTELDLSAVRGRDVGPGANLPGKATITLNRDDMEDLDKREEEQAKQNAAAGSRVTPEESVGRFLVDLIAHEIGHALGLSRDIWRRTGFLTENPGTNKPVFTGPAATRTFGTLLHTGPTDVPLEIFGNKGEFISHWRQAIFHSELMTFLLEDRPNVIGPVTVAALQDLGYQVDASARETDGIDLGDSGPLAPSPPVAAPGPVHQVIRDRRWINCRVRAR